jgi:hypothetical protein
MLAFAVASGVGTCPGFDQTGYSIVILFFIPYILAHYPIHLSYRIRIISLDSMHVEQTLRVWYREVLFNSANNRTLPWLSY